MRKLMGSSGRAWLRPYCCCTFVCGNSLESLGFRGVIGIPGRGGSREPPLHLVSTPCPPKEPFFTNRANFINTDRIKIDIKNRASCSSLSVSLVGLRQSCAGQLRSLHNLDTGVFRMPQYRAICQRFAKSPYARERILKFARLQL